MTTQQNTTDLLAFVSAHGGERQLRVEENLGQGFVRLRISEAERRQAQQDIRCVEDVVVEMLRNARDAGAHHIYVATAREEGKRTITMLDDGQGIPPELQDRIFEARVTSKLDSAREDLWGVHGRGMALFSVRERCDSAKVMSSGVGKGSAIQVVCETANLPERADQSSWPTIGVNEDGERSVVRGPHNIIRACCAFALEEEGACEVYLGSPAEIMATARRRVKVSARGSALLFMESTDELPVLERLAAAVDAHELQDVGAKLGLDVSERTAHRVVSGRIRPLRSVYSQLLHKDPSASGEIDLMRDRRGLRVAEHDLKAFQKVMEEGFAYLGERYYLTLLEDPRVRVSKDKITVTFDIAEQD